MIADDRAINIIKGQEKLIHSRNVSDIASSKISHQNDDPSSFHKKLQDEESYKEKKKQKTELSVASTKQGSRSTKPKLAKKSKTKKFITARKKAERSDNN